MTYIELDDDARRAVDEDGYFHVAWKVIARMNPLCLASVVIWRATAGDFTQKNVEELHQVIITGKPPGYGQVAGVAE